MRIIDTMETESVKNDFKDHKLRWDLLPLQEIEDIVKVYTAGAEKYGPNNWQHLEDGYTGIIRAYPTKEYCYLLRSEKDKNGDSSEMLIQIDWEGNLIHSYKFKDHVSGQFYINEDSNTLYIICNYIRSDDEDIFAIISYNLL